MVLSEEKKREYSGRILLSRMRILNHYGFYGLLLMHMKFRLDETCPTAATDGEYIIFGPMFLEKLSDSELDFIMMHEIMHVALRHMQREDKRNSEQFNIACDIVVNSNILKSCDMDCSAITLKAYGESMHLAPNGKEGYLYNAEEMFALLESGSGSGKGNDSRMSKGSGSGKGSNPADGDNGNNADTSSDLFRNDKFRDDHSRWKAEEKGSHGDAVWKKRILDAAEAIRIRNSSTGRGELPVGMERVLEAFIRPQVDWRRVLADFVQEEICDYSFSPPDRRFPDSPFLLPDYNDTRPVASGILFMIDTSGSMSDRAVTAVYSEVKGALEQFGDALQGWLGFFDAAVVEPVPFCDMESFLDIVPYGGGGTDFHILFSYVKDFMQKEEITSIIILTDGYAPYPPESDACGIPVLWLLTEEGPVPPWGKVVRIHVEDDEKEE